MVFPGTDYHPVLTCRRTQKRVQLLFNLDFRHLATSHSQAVRNRGRDIKHADSLCWTSIRYRCFRRLAVALVRDSAGLGIGPNCRNRTGDAGYASTPLFQCSSCRHNPVQHRARVCSYRVTISSAITLQLDRKGKCYWMIGKA
jgi:hypothetical protein